MSRHRSWCFTLNNYIQTELELIDGLASSLTTPFTYLVYGFEKGENETPHLQGYFQLKGARDMKYLKNHFSLRAHYEVARGNAEDNYKYCTKQGNFKEFGIKPKQGKRSDIMLAKQMVLENNTMLEIAQETTSFQALRYAETLKKYAEPKRNFETKVYWFYGKTGSGKTKKASEMFPNAYWHTGTQWWDGYDAHEDVIIDDFRQEQFTLPELLKMFQPYPYQVKIKGGFRQLLAKNIVITTPYPPEALHYGSEDIQQLIRRITVLKEF